MPRRLFSPTLLLLCLLLCCGNSGAAAANQEDVMDPFAATTEIHGAAWEGVGAAAQSVPSLRVPSLVAVGEDVFAVAEAHCMKQDGEAGCVTGIASKHLKETVEGAAMEISAADTSLLCTRLVEGSDAADKKAMDIMRPTTLVVGSDVYMLLGRRTRTEPEEQAAGKTGWKLVLVKGTVTGDGDNGKKLEWGKTRAVQPGSAASLNSLTQLVGGGGSGLVLGDGTLVFPMQAIKEKKSVLLAMRLGQSENTWTLSSGTTGEGCRDPSIVKWGEDEELLAMAPCAGGSYEVYESTAAGTAWYPTGEPITRVWGTSLNRQGGDGVQSGFITATFVNKKVMLLTTPVYSEEEGNGKGRLHLWLTDNSRVHDVGPVSREADDAAASSLLYRSGAPAELILLYEKKKDGGSYDLVSLSLAKQLDQIKSVVQTWKEMDAALQSCTSSAAVDTRKQGVCNGPVPTKGLVGLLANTLAGTAWVDEYRGVNATVKGGAATSEKGGVTFKGSGSWAEWPVGSRGQNQPYYFANNGFTLVATVTIHLVPVPAEDTPLLGVRMNDAASTVLVGVSCTQDKKWKVTVGGKNRSLSDDDVTWKPGTAYQVILQMGTGDELSVYVDGDGIYDGEEDDDEVEDDGIASEAVAELFKPHRISHFYVGGGGAEGTKSSHHVTVSSVLLYNRALGKKEITQLKNSKVAQPRPAAAGSGAGPAAAGAGAGPAAASPGPSDDAEDTDDTLEQESGEMGVDGIPAAGALPQRLPDAKAPPNPTVQADAANPSSLEPVVESSPSAPPSPAEVKIQAPGDSDETVEAGGGAQSPQPPEEAKREGGGHGGGGAELHPDGHASPSAAAAEEGVGEEESSEDASASPPAPSASSVAPPAAPGGSQTHAGEPATASESPAIDPEEENAAPGPVVSSGGSPALTDNAEPPAAKEAPGTSSPATAEMPRGDNEEVPQGVESAPANKNTPPAPQAAPASRDAGPHLSNSSAAFKSMAGLRLSEGDSDGAVRGRVSWPTLLTLLALCGVAAGF
ncbi:trans-sialidase [Trypanosoma conorhini]|uniref:Trans-sialidase n=1 Tax=Trypanosoma conorhini TaxID=83891 RepID=A0A3R7MDB8_9TRYP|nr:trans-sialidase [Trypanosoma conorhini]RNF00503.1 trans-sialidase [Trypanosoma conorhini]